MKQLRNQNGFTLVEAVVTGLIAAIVGGVFITFLKMHNDALKEGIASSKMQMQSDIVSSELARKIREANLAMAPGETWMKGPSLTAKDTTHIVLYDDDGLVTGAYKVSGGVLLQSTDGATFSVFKAGGDSVKLVSGSAFGLNDHRDEVTLKLKVTLQYKSTTYSTMSKGDMYLCRN